MYAQYKKLESLGTVQNFGSLFDDNNSCERDLQTKLRRKMKFWVFLRHRTNRSRKTQFLEGLLPLPFLPHDNGKQWRRNRTIVTSRLVKHFINRRNCDVRRYSNFVFCASHLGQGICPLPLIDNSAQTQLLIWTARLSFATFVCNGITLKWDLRFQNLLMNRFSYLTQW